MFIQFRNPQSKFGFLILNRVFTLNRHLTIARKIAVERPHHLKSTFKHPSKLKSSRREISFGPIHVTITIIWIKISDKVEGRIYLSHHYIQHMHFHSNY